MISVAGTGAINSWLPLPHLHMYNSSRPRGEEKKITSPLCSKIRTTIESKACSASSPPLPELKCLLEREVPPALAKPPSVQEGTIWRCLAGGAGKLFKPSCNHVGRVLIFCLCPDRVASCFPWWNQLRILIFPASSKRSRGRGPPFQRAAGMQLCGQEGPGRPGDHRSIRPSARTGNAPAFPSLQWDLQGLAVELLAHAPRLAFLRPICFLHEN